VTLIISKGTKTFSKVSLSHLKPSYLKIIEICKVRKRQHQNPEFGHKDGEIKKQPAKKKTVTFNNKG
jgi:hypothetical protein